MWMNCGWSFGPFRLAAGKKLRLVQGQLQTLMARSLGHLTSLSNCADDIPIVFSLQRMELTGTWEPTVEAQWRHWYSCLRMPQDVPTIGMNWRSGAVPATRLKPNINTNVEQTRSNEPF